MLEIGLLDWDGGCLPMKLTQAPFDYTTMKKA
jgi:hypothetical protein